jgi:hypothetical protein
MTGGRGKKIGNSPATGDRAAGLNKKENIQYSTRNFQCPRMVSAFIKNR